MTTRVRDIVIAGAGLAGVHVAKALRILGCDRRIALISAEDELPYDRPPLSKDYLLGRVSDDDIRLVSEAWYAESDVELMLGRPARSLDPHARSLVVGDGEELRYEDLVVATGARPRPLPGLPVQDGMLHLRDTSDARALRSALASRPRLAVVGAGFIGLEVAAVATQMGAPVTVIEAAATPLATVLGTELGGWLQAWHEDRGIAFRCSTVVTGTTAQARGRRLALSDGTSLVADVVVLGVGVSPNVGWLDRSGVEVHVGVVCDEHGRTTHPHVLAVGDVTCRHVGGRCLPSGHWTAASEQAFGVAATLLGNGAPPMPPPQEGYFWSDQFDARFQFAGAFEPGASFTLTAGSLEDTEFVGTLAAQHGLCAAFAMNSPRGFTRAVRDLGRTLRPTPT